VEGAHAAAGPAWAALIEHSAVGQALRNSLWLFPAVETLHIVGFALLVGAIVTFDVRVIGAKADLDLRRWQRAVLPIVRAGFLLAVPMGMLLFATEATAFVRNPAFRLKLLLIALALANVGLFHRLARGRPWVSPGLRLAAGVSLLLWLAALTMGRLIAYV
jgi:hypothetical protein